MSNSDNPRNGAIFQRQVLDWFANKYNRSFEQEVEIPIGSRLLDAADYKNHKFDVVSDDRTIVIECKRYTWTETGNVPSAKMGFVNEAAFYLSLVDKSHKKYIVMLEDYNSYRKETLAEYYYRTNKHLLGDVVIAEYNPDSKHMRFINESEIEQIWLRRLNKFAGRYLSLYSNSAISEEYLCDSFASECFDLGLNMDCGKSFISKYGEESFSNVVEFKKVCRTVTDIELLGSMIFSKWRFITHSDCSNCTDDGNREWFIEAFTRLIDLTSDSNELT